MTKKSKIFNVDASPHLSAKMFFDDNGGPAIARYEEVKYPQFEKFTEQQMGFFWQPQEIDLSKDKLDFRDLPPEQQHIFTSNLFRQILLDSIQGRGPNLVFLPLTGLPEVEVWIETWGANETVHSRSYTHIIRNIYANPSEVFDKITNIPEITACAADVSKYYDDLASWNSHREIFLSGEKLVGKTYDEYAHKKSFWLAMNNVNVLEGIRFYVSFACSWNFAEAKKMEGNAKEIRLICRDENLHLGATQYMLRTLVKDDPDFAKIKIECEDDVIQMFVAAVQQEHDWAKYLFQDGSMIGLNEEILCQYVSFIASKRMRSIGLEAPFEYPKSDPLPWTKNWISGRDVQVAPQEAEITSYTVGDVVNDIDGDTLGNMSL